MLKYSRIRAEDFNNSIVFVVLLFTIVLTTNYGLNYMYPSTIRKGSLTLSGGQSTKRIFTNILYRFNQLHLNNKKMKKQFSFYFILLLFPLLTQAQVWTTYNTNNSGLAEDLVYCIAADAQGNKWFGTYTGLSTFDGSNWHTYYTSNSGLANDQVRAIAIDAQGTKWFGTSYDGVSKFDGTTWTTYNTNNSGLCYDNITSIAIDAQGNKWFGTIYGVSMFNGTTWTTYNTNNSGIADDYINSVAIDAQGNKWFGSAYSGLSKFNGTTWTVYNTGNSGLSHNKVQSIAIDAQNNIWIGTMGGGINKFDGTNWASYHTGNSGLKDNNVTSIAIDSRNNIWIAGYDYGISKFDGSSWTAYNTNNSGLADDAVFSIAVDARDNVWAGTYSGGVSTFGCVSFVPAITANGNTLSTATGYNSYQWSLNGTAIPGATNNTYTAQANGDYTVAVVDNNGCSGTSDVFPFSSTGIENITAASVKIYPNPANGVVYIASPVPVNATLIAVDGKVILSEVKAVTLNLEKVPAGVYSLKLTDEAGKFIKTEQLVLLGE